MLSGVVTMADGKRFSCFARSVLELSLVLFSTVHGIPIVATGSCKAFRVSVASARSGVIQITVRGDAVFLLIRLWVRFGSTSEELRGMDESQVEMAPSHTARVFPVPVGLCSRPLLPDRQARQTLF